MRSSDIGHFEAPYLRPGNYQVRVAAPGFRAIVRERVPVQVESRVRLDFALEVGEVSNTVEVVGQIPLLESESSSLGTVVGSKSIQELPLRGRNVFDLVGLSPAVQVTPFVGLGQTGTGSYSSFVASDISINGGRFRTNEYLVDGVSILLPENNNYAFAPTPDGTQEFKVQTSDYGPQFGRSGGGVINVITRGGSNELHGSISEFFRNDRLTANGFFNNLRNQARPVYHFNLFGAAIGGPVIKNRTFFFGEYQGHRQDTAGAGSVATLPTAAQRSGDFSRTLNSTGQQVVLYDPQTTRPAPAGTGFVREVFPGNVIPAARFDRVSANMLKYVPLPNRPGRTPAELDNYGFTSPSLNNSDYWTVRVDHRFSERHGIFGRFTRTLGLDSAKGPFGTIADNTLGDTNNRVINAAVNDTLTLTPTRVLTWRLGFTRRFEGRGDLHEGETSLVELGFPSSIPAAIQEQIFPAVGMNGYTGWGPPGGERIRRGNDIYTAVADQTEMHGRHTLIYGGDFRLYNQTPFQGGTPSGAYNFGRDFTQGPDPLRASLTAGDGFGSLLLGYGSGSINLVPAFAIRNYYLAGYLNDDIRLGRLTINIGVRYEYEQPRTERYNRFANFDFQRNFPLNVGAFPNLRGVLSLAGRDNPRGQFEPAYTNLGPRFGLAYRLTPRTVVRAGFGLFYAPRIGSTAASQFGATGAQIDTSWVSSLDGVTPLNPFSNPFPQGLLQPPSNRAEQLFLGQGLNITDRDNRNNNYAEQWNLSIQRELPGQIAFEGAYSGSRGIRNTMLMEWNQLNPSNQSLRADLNRQVPNPFFGLVRTGTLAQATVAQSQLLRPYPQYTNISTNWQNMAASTYHSYQMKIEKRFSNSMNFMVAYTASKLIDDSSGRVFGFNSFTPEVQNFYDLRSERAVSEADVSQRLVISHTIDLPFGRGKSLLKNLPGPVNKIAGGWSVSGVATFFTGFPLKLSSAGNSGVSGSRVLRPNSTGQSARLGGDVQTRLGRFFDTSAFTIPEPFTFGNTGRTLPDVRGAGRRSYDVTLSKVTPITERFNAVFRAETYNLTNTPYFGLPGTSLGSANFGVINGSSGQRVVQLSLRIQF